MGFCMDTKKMSVEEIRNILINDYKLTKDEILTIKGKSNLVNKLLDIESKDNVNNNDSFNIAGLEILDEPKTIDRTDKGWSKYVIDQLADDEKDGIYPKADGLRRLLESHVSPIISIDNCIMQSPCSANGMVATVRAKITLANGEEYTAAADAQRSDLEYPYDRHVTAIAETRAEGRVFRKALRLKNIVTKEEMVDAKQDAQDRINKNQVMLIDNLCMNNRLNVNVSKLLKYLFKDTAKANVWEYTHSEGAEINRKLTEFQGDSNLIPAELLGYSPDWK